MIESYTLINKDLLWEIIRCILDIQDFKIRMIVKVASGFILGTEVLFFAMLPYFYSSTLSNKKITQIFNNFSAGLFMGISFLHIIPQANQSIDNWLGKDLHHHHEVDSDGGHHHQIPYGTLISLITFMLVLAIQVYMNDGHCASQSIEKRSNTHMHQVLSNQKLKMRRRLLLQTYLTQLALSVHSFFECMSIGIQKSQKVTIALATAIVFHKWAQALTLGFSYSVSGMPKQTAFKLALFHSFLNAGAVLIGYQLSQTSQIVKGVTNGISGGTFIYICMIQKINKSFTDNENLLAKLGLVFAGLAFSILILN